MEVDPATWPLLGRGEPVPRDAEVVARLAGQGRAVNIGISTPTRGMTIFGARARARVVGAGSGCARELRMALTARELGPMRAGPRMALTVRGPGAPGCGGGPECGGSRLVGSLR